MSDGEMTGMTGGEVAPVETRESINVGGAGRPVLAKEDPPVRRSDEGGPLSGRRRGMIVVVRTDDIRLGDQAQVHGRHGRDERIGSDRVQDLQVQS